MSRLGARRAGVNRSPRADNLPPVQHPFAWLKYRIFGHPGKRLDCPHSSGIGDVDEAATLKARHLSHVLSARPKS